MPIAHFLTVNCGTGILPVYEQFWAGRPCPYGRTVLMATSTLTNRFQTVYGPVASWRYGRSLGIDPIGEISTCSFNCVYCQLGEIERKTQQRKIYISTEQILKDLKEFAPWDVDVITLSGSGEPTLATNLAEILTEVKTLTCRSTLVLTNGTTLNDPQVCAELGLADQVSVKLDGVSADQFQRINRPVSGISLDDVLTGLQQFASVYRGELSVQTMILSPWKATEKAAYIRWMQAIAPKEIHLNTPTRPKPVNRELEGRENHNITTPRSYPVRILKCVQPEVLAEFADEIEKNTGIRVRYPKGS